MFTKPRISFGFGIIFGASMVELIDKYYTKKLVTHIASSRYITHWGKF